MTASVEPGRFRDCRRRWWPLSVQTRLKISTGGELSCFGKRPEHALDQRGVAIFLDLPDLAVLDSEHQAIVVVVPLGLAESAKTCCTNFLLSAALMAVLH